MAMAMKKLTPIILVLLVIGISPVVSLAGTIEDGLERVRLFPNDANAHFNLGVAYTKSSQLQQAIASYKKVLKIIPNDTGALNNLGHAYIHLNRYKEAINVLKEVVRLNPDHANAHYNLGSVYKAINLNDRAIAAYKEVLRINPSDTTARNDLNQLEQKIAEKAVVPVPLHKDILEDFEELKIKDSLPETSQAPEMDLVKELEQLAKMDVSPMLLPDMGKETPETAESPQKSDEFYDSILEKLASFSVESEPVKVAVSRARLDSSSFQSKLRTLPKSSQATTGGEISRKSGKRVRATTKGVGLRVRLNPDLRSSVVGTVSSSMIMSVYQETSDWSQIEYQKGKKGWIRKKYLRLVDGPAEAQGTFPQKDIHSPYPNGDLTKLNEILDEVYGPNQTLDNDEPVSLETTEVKYASYFAKIKHQIERVWIYPSDAAKRGISGDLNLTFSISKDGNLLGVRLLDRSGYEILDMAALKAVKEAAPFYPFPSTIQREKLTIQARFIYTPNP